MAELEKPFAGGAPASGTATRGPEEMMARMDALIKAGNEQIARYRPQPEKTNWPVILAVLLVLVIALLVGTGLPGR